MQDIDSDNVEIDTSTQDKFTIMAEKTNYIRSVNFNRYLTFIILKAMISASIVTGIITFIILTEMKK